VTSHLFGNELVEFRRVASRARKQIRGKGGEGWPDVSKHGARGMAPFSNTRAALAWSSRRWLVPYARTPCRPVVEGQAQSNRAVSGSKFNVLSAERYASFAARGAGRRRVCTCTCTRVRVYVGMHALRQKRHTRNESHEFHAVA